MFYDAAKRRPGSPGSANSLTGRGRSAGSRRSDRARPRHLAPYSFYSASANIPHGSFSPHRDLGDTRPSQPMNAESTREFVVNMV